MAKKNFSGGLDSLLGGSSISKSNETPKAAPQKTTEQPSQSVQPSIGNFLDDEQQKQITALAQKEGRSEEEIIKEAISFYLKFQVDL